MHVVSWILSGIRRLLGSERFFLFDFVFWVFLVADCVDPEKMRKKSDRM